MPMQPLQLYLHARNMDETVAFYRDVLGFEVTNTMPMEDGSLGHAELQHGGVHLMFGPASTLPGGGPENLGGGAILYLRVDGEDIDEYYNAVVARGSQIAAPLADQPWGDRSFVALDPSGYQLMIARPGAMPEMTEAGAAAAH